MKQTFITDKHYFIDTIVISGEIKRNDLSDKLILPIIEKAEKEGYKIYLENYNPEFQPLYFDYGFEIIKETIVPNTNIILYNLIK